MRSFSCWLVATGEPTDLQSFSCGGEGRDEEGGGVRGARGVSGGVCDGMVLSSRGR